MKKKPKTKPKVNVADIGTDNLGITNLNLRDCKEWRLVTSIKGEMIECPHCHQKWFDSWSEVDGVKYCGECFDKTFPPESVRVGDMMDRRDEPKCNCPNTDMEHCIGCELWTAEEYFPDDVEEDK